ncbi:MAG: hypothetical protein HOC71_13755, partial [Candidatus Latescibacteria bacterium]|nr:hypothetical protein [Candidatus Latescibacterota bacterium]
MAKKKRTTAKKAEPARKSGEIIPLQLPIKPDFIALAGYILIAITLTFPLVLRMNSSVYGFYDHISTDLFGIIQIYFWWIKHAIIDLKTSPIMAPIFAAPFGSRINFTNFTGFALFPVTAVFGHIFSRNFVILLNLIVSGMGMFYLVRHITKNPTAGFISGVIFAFCPNMMVRSYTTFDTTQVQWIPLYTLFVLKFIENRTWKNALLTALFLVCNILFTMPYYLVYLPVHTVVVLLVYAGWRVWIEKRKFGGFVKDITSPESIKAWVKITAALGCVIVVFLIYFTVVVGGSEFSSSTSFQHKTEKLDELSLKSTDYLMPHPRSAFLKGNIKESYWNTKRPGKDPDSFVAYIGYVALILALTGAVKGRKGVYTWILIAGAFVAFWSTLGPSLFGIPTPSGMIHALYASFARRILIYKVFVQMGVAGLAGTGTCYIIERIKSRNGRLLLPVVLTALILFEYTLVPPALSVDLRNNPEIYERVKELPEESMLIEVPLRRNNGNLFQGYQYYQTIHEKNLFNPYFGISQVPESIRPFYTNMAVPLEAQSYANLAALRYLGITHLVNHWIIRTTTVNFGFFFAPGIFSDNVEGLKKIYTCNRDPNVGPYPSPFDYTFADLYEITAEPCPVALTFDYKNPYESVEGIIRQEMMLPWGRASALVDTTKTFYYPVADGERL